MKKLFLTLLIIFVPAALFGQAELQRRLTEHVHILASDSLMGRKAGSPDAMRAAEYIMDSFREIGLRPFAGDSTYLQPFGHAGVTYHNILGYIEGADPALRGEYIVLGAHYDHLGAHKRKNKTVIYNGADDNASGVAALIEIARMLKAQEGSLRRTVIFAAFDAEEIGLVGSDHLASVLPPGGVKFMVSMDMIGWLRAGGGLSIAGVGTLRDGYRLMESLNVPAGLNVRLRKFDNKITGDSDHGSFARRKVPAFYATTGLKSPYHQPEDTAEKIDYEGMALVTEYLAGMAAALASESALTPSGHHSRKHYLPRTEFGITASMGHTGYRYADGSPTEKGSSAWSAGLFMQYHMGHFALRPGLLYRQCGANYRASGDEEGISELLTSAISVPVTAMIKFPRDHATYIYASAGGYYSCILSASLGGRRLTVGPDANRHEAGWIAGFGCAMVHLGFEYTYHHSLTRVRKTGPEIKNQSHQLSLHYKF